MGKEDLSQHKGTKDQRDKEVEGKAARRPATDLDPLILCPLVLKLLTH